MAGPFALIPIVLGAAGTIYKISAPLFKRYSSQLTKASKEAVDNAKNIKRLSSNQLIKKLGGGKPTKASLSQEGVKNVVKKGAAGVFAAGVGTGYLLTKDKKEDKKEDKKKSKLATTPGRKPQQGKLFTKPGRKPPPPLPKAKKVKPHSKPPKNMKNPMTMGSGTKKYANGGSVRKPKGTLN